MRIDAHLHFWQPGCGFDNRPVADNVFYRRDFMPGDVRPALDACGIDGVILVQTAPQTQESDWIIDLGRDDERVWGITAWVDLDGPDVDFAALAARPKVVGIRAQLRRIADSSFVARPQVSANLASALRAGLNVTVLAEARHYRVLADVLDALPPGPITLNHLALPFPEVETESWRAALRRFVARPDTYVQFSGVPFLFGEHWHDAAAYSRMADAFAICGPQRLMFASDWPMVLRFARYEEWFAAASTFIAAQALSPQDSAAIFAGNALRANPRIVVPLGHAAAQPLQCSVQETP